MYVLWTPVCILIFAFIWSKRRFVGNFYRARQVGLPYVSSPVAPLDIAWILSFKLLVPLLKLLPLSLGAFARYTYIGWQFDDKFSAHEELGGAFMLVTPGNNELVLAEPGAVNEMLTRRRDFIKPRVLYGQHNLPLRFDLNRLIQCCPERLNLFGPNVDTVRYSTHPK